MNCPFKILQRSVEPGCRDQQPLMLDDCNSRRVSRLWAGQSSSHTRRLYVAYLVHSVMLKWPSPNCDHKCRNTLQSNTSLLAVTLRFPLFGRKFYDVDLGVHILLTTWTTETGNTGRDREWWKVIKVATVSSLSRIPLLQSYQLSIRLHTIQHWPVLMALVYK